MNETVINLLNFSALSSKLIKSVSCKVIFCIILFSSFIVVISGCAGGGFKLGIDTHTQSFEEMPEPHELLEGAPPICVVLPPSAPSNYAPLVGSAFFSALKACVSKATVVQSGRTATLINTAGQTSELNNMLQGYAISGILDSNSLISIGSAIGGEYALMPSLIVVSHNEENRLSFFGASLLFSSWTHVQASLQLWRLKDGALVWQSIGSGSIDAETPGGTAVALYITVQQVFESMLEDLLEKRNMSVLSCELPEQLPDSNEKLNPDKAENKSSQNTEMQSGKELQKAKV